MLTSKHTFRIKRISNSLLPGCGTPGALLPDKLLLLEP